MDVVLGNWNPVVAMMQRTPATVRTHQRVNLLNCTGTAES